MIPLHFGSRARILFGAFTPATGGKRHRGVVICNPWGMEALRAHRALKHLSDSLAREGLDVLRFDYYGTGDSMGDSDDTSLSGHVADTLLAAEELEALASVRRIDLVGLRLGSYIAAITLGRLAHGGDLVLWDPVLDGSHFVDELRDGSKDPDRDSSLEVGGFTLPEHFQHELRAAPPLRINGLGSRVLLALSEPPENGLLAEAAASDLAVKVVTGPGCWVEERDFGAGAVPVGLVNAVTEWLK